MSSVDDGDKKLDKEEFIALAHRRAEEANVMVYELPDQPVDPRRLADAKEHGMDAGWEVPSALLHDTAHAPAWCLPRLSSLLLTPEHGRSSLEARLRPP